MIDRDDCIKQWSVGEFFYYIKINFDKFSNGCVNNLSRWQVNHPTVNYSHTRSKGCLQLIYVSSNHNCGQNYVSVRLSQIDGRNVNISVPTGTDFYSTSFPSAVCTNFDPNDGNLVLVITKSGHTCTGQLVISVNITAIEYPPG